MRLFLAVGEAQFALLKFTCIPLRNPLDEKYEFE